MDWPMVAPDKPSNWIHLCVDMQRMFAEQTEWHVPWMASVSDGIVELTGRFPGRTIFTRFIPPRKAGDVPGMWRVYYEKWDMMTAERLPAEMVEIVPDLNRFCPPAKTFDKHTYSPWTDGRLHSILKRDGINTLVLTGGETDICVLAAVFGAIDLGYRVIVLKDAVCSGADATHDATLELLGGRFSVQVEIMDTKTLLSKVL